MDYEDRDEEEEEDCPECEGSGACIDCLGTGENEDPDDLDESHECLTCEGTGNCPFCNGYGYL